METLPLLLVVGAALAMQATAQTQEVCYAERDCSGIVTSSGTTLDRCCLMQGGMSFVAGNGACQNCIVVQLLANSFQGSEEEGVAVLQLGRDGVLDEAVGVTIVLTEGTARGGFDFGLFPAEVFRFTAVLPPNETVVQFGVFITDDEIVETMEDFSAMLQHPLGSELLAMGLPSNPPGVVIGEQDRANVSILDNDVVDVNITIAENATIALEGERLELVISKDGTAVRDISVTISIQPLTAQAGDFALVGDGVVIFSPSDTFQSVMVDIVDDAIVEGLEEFLVVVQPSLGEIGVFVSVNESLIQIEDTDQLEIEFATMNVEVPESIGAVPIVLRKIGQNEIPVSVQLMAMNGSAVLGQNYNFTGQTVVFGPSDVTQTLLVDILQNGIVEDPNMFTLELTVPDDEERVEIRPPTAITVTILDSDTVTVGFGSAEAVVGEQDGFLSLAVQLLEGELGIQLSFDIVVEAAMSPVAEVNSDFALPMNPTFSLQPGITIAVVLVAITDDETFEGEENFVLSIMPADTRMRTDPGLIEVVISDNEDLSINFTEAVYQVFEGDSSVTVTVDLFSLLERPLELQLFTRNERATAGSDYSPVNMTLSFTPDVSQRSVTIQLFDDDISEGIEEFLVLLGATDPSDQTLQIVAQAVVEITDNENLEVGLSQSEYTANEGDGFVTIVIAKSGITVRDVLVTVQLTGGTAQGGTDFGPFPATYSTITLSAAIAANATEVLFGIPLIDDSIVETSEDFSVSLALSEDELAFGTTLLQADATVIIEDNDAINITLTPSGAVAVGESSGQLSFTIQRTDDAPLDRNVSVVFTVQPQTASMPEDFDSNVTENLVFTASRSVFNVIIAIQDDLIAEGDENFLVFLSTPSGAGGALFIENQTQVQITDDDVALVQFEFARYEVNEAAGVVNVCLTKDRDTATSFTVTLEPAETAANPPESFPARANIDFISDPVDVLFQPASRQSCADIVIVTNDALGEGLELFVISFTLPQVSAVEIGAIQNATVEIQDIEEVAIGFERQTTIAVFEGAAVDLCVRVFNPLLDQPLDATITVRAAVEDITTDGSDYMLLSGEVLTFNETSRRQCLTFLIAQDVLAEGTELFQVQLSLVGDSSSGAGLLTDLLAVSIIDIVQDVVVGFGRPLETVLEDAGQIDVCVEVTTPSVDEQLNSQVSLSASTVPGSAMSPANFGSITNLQLQFNDTIRVVCITIQVFSVDGGDRDFTIQLATANANVDLVLQQVSVIIIDIVDPVTATPSPSPDPTTFLENATVVGDPLFAVPLNLQNGADMLPAAAMNMTLFLCFEVHGAADRHFNLVSDSCTSVNALYSQADAEFGYFRNVISRIGVRAVNSDGLCVDIDVNVENQCMPMMSVAGGSFTEVMRFSSAGVSIRKNRNYVRISVPNCENVRLVMLVTCQELDGDFPMIRFDITRGANLRPTSHGLIGQFWNIPITVERFTFTGPTDSYFADESLQLFEVTVNPVGSPSRSFVSDLGIQKWDRSRDICLYSGNIQAGKIREVDDPNDSVIEGTYSQYRTNELFNTSFMYTKFEQSCE